MSFIGEALQNELSRLYSAHERKYHGLSHVHALLQLLDQYRTKFSDPLIVEAAIWFHDAIYDSRAKDNEQKSADLAVEKLAPSIGDSSLLVLIRDMILATATHTVPPFSDPGPLADTALFLDMDLSILGADDAVFDQYEAAVREEYSWADDATWNHGRAAVLESFLAREHIFHTEIFRHRFEAQARRNIARSLERLAHRAGQ